MQKNTKYNLDNLPCSLVSGNPCKSNHPQTSTGGGGKSSVSTNLFLHGFCVLLFMSQNMHFFLTLSMFPPAPFGFSFLENHFTQESKDNLPCNPIFGHFCCCCFFLTFWSASCMILESACHET